MNAADDSLKTIAAEIEELRKRGREQHAVLSKALRERDEFQKRAEELERTCELYQRTNKFLPIVGVTCDVDGCSSAVGLVGMRVADVDDVAPAMHSVAISAGWTCTNGTRYTCPDCERNNRRLTPTKGTRQ